MLAISANRTIQYYKNEITVYAIVPKSTNCILTLVICGGRDSTTKWPTSTRYLGRNRFMTSSDQSYNSCANIIDDLNPIIPNWCNLRYLPNPTGTSRFSFSQIDIVARLHRATVYLVRQLCIKSFIKIKSIKCGPKRGLLQSLRLLDGLCYSFMHVPTSPSGQWLSTGLTVG